MTGKLVIVRRNSRISRGLGSLCVGIQMEFYETIYIPLQLSY